MTDDTGTAGTGTAAGAGRHGADDLRDAEEAAGAAGGEVAAFDQSQSPLDRLQRYLHRRPLASPSVVLLLAFLFFSIVGERFLTATNVSTILAQVMIIGTLGIAQTLVILTAGIDLSVGAIVLFSSVVMGKLAVTWGWNPWLGLLFGLGIGLAAGAANGLLVTRLRLPPFIATLGTLSVFGALAQWFSDNVTVRNSDVVAEADILLWFGNVWEPVSGFRITFGALFMLLLYAFFTYALQNTAWGEHVYAVGDNPETARLVGIRGERVLLSVYTVAGLLCGLAGWLWIGRIGAVSPIPLVNANLESITAVVIGGTSLFGGRGLVLGTLIGALIVGIFDSGLSQLGFEPLWRVFAVGVLVLVAVGLDQWIRRVGS
ncbi:MAG: ABC transporter permease [Nitriliruptorales bacterium]|nr:ABC transporter permease [Nitriliruptorales bacterium]